MPKYIRNAAGAIHSVPDDFDLDAHDGFEEVTEDTAKGEHAHLFGEADPAVEAVRAHDGAGNPVTFDALGNPSTVANPPVEDTLSTAPTGDPDPRIIEATPETKPAKGDAKHSAEVTA